MPTTLYASQDQSYYTDKHVGTYYKGSLTKKRVIIPSRGSYVYAEVDSIVYMEADSNYTRLYLVDGRTHYTSKTLKYWQNQVNSDTFLRIHSKHLVNSLYVTQVDTKRSVIMLGDVSLLISRSRKRNVVRKMMMLTAQSDKG